MERVSLGKVVRDVLEKHRSGITRRGIKVNVHLDPVTILSDERNLSQLFSSIISLALHSPREHSPLKIDISTLTSEDAIDVVFRHEHLSKSRRGKESGESGPWSFASLAREAAGKKDIGTLARTLGCRYGVRISDARRCATVTVSLPR